MPAEGVALIPHDDILHFEEIIEVVKEAVKIGIFKFRITGGEPLVRKDIVKLVKMIAEVEGVKDLAMTTNGVFLTKYAQALKDAGLMRINISLDTVDSQKFNSITRIGSLNEVMAGIQAAKDAGLSPIKINCVIKKNRDESDAQGVANYCKENNLQIRYIREMDLEKGSFYRVQGGDGGECAICNRLRLTANGKIKPCLFNNISYDVRTLGAKNALLYAIDGKPESGTVNNINTFNNIGG
jgi:cyclic pyranopterin phosphate synthase